MFRHVVLLRWVDGAAPEAVDAVLEGLAGLPAAIPELRSYVFGPDAGVNEGNFDLAIVADFGSVEDYLVYRDHPAHQALIAERIAPILAGRAAVQCELPR
ncbi:MAG: Dabb family protein [Microthrixaceae bacterium]|nr:Dabb family protein [Microthrixaceae bacterium]